jgi:hypothetical protein
VTVDRLRRAQVAIAYVVMRHGPAYAPLFDRIERDLAAAESADSVEARARRVLEDQCVDVTSNAILVSQ